MLARKFAVLYVILPVLDTIGLIYVLSSSGHLWEGSVG